MARITSSALPTRHHIALYIHHIALHHYASHLHCTCITLHCITPHSHCAVILCAIIIISRIFTSPGIACLEIESLGSAYCLRWHPQQRNTLCSLPAQHDTRGSARPRSLSRHYVLSTACTTPTSYTTSTSPSLRAELNEWYPRARAVHRLAHNISIPIA